MGSLASLTGMFIASIVSGVIGAIAINMIDRYIASKKREEITGEKITKHNEILQIQEDLIYVETQQVEITKNEVNGNIQHRHEIVAEHIKASVKAISNNSLEQNEDPTLFDNTLNEVRNMLNDF